MINHMIVRKKASISTICTIVKTDALYEVTQLLLGYSKLFFNKFLAKSFPVLIFQK